MFSVLVIVLITPVLQAQNRKNQKAVRDIYMQLQTGNSSAINQLKLNNDTTGDRYTITLYAILRHEWTGVYFDKIQLQEVGKDKIEVTGKVTGRQPTECEIVSTNFKHMWTLRDGQIIKFDDSPNHEKLHELSSN